MPNRHFAPSDDNSYGFQGQEMDDEVKGKGVSANYKYRMNDTRIGRFFAVDPLESNFEWNSPYAFSENRVIDAIELEGAEKLIVTFSFGKVNKQHIRVVDMNAPLEVTYMYTTNILSVPSKEIKKVTTEKEIDTYTKIWKDNPRNKEIFGEASTNGTLDNIHPTSPNPLTGNHASISKLGKFETDMVFRGRAVARVVFGGPSSGNVHWASATESEKRAASIPIKAMRNKLDVLAKAYAKGEAIDIVVSVQISLDKTDDVSEAVTYEKEAIVTYLISKGVKDEDVNVTRNSYGRSSSRSKVTYTKIAKPTLEGAKKGKL